ncbi:uncharacterized protein UHOD_11140 [Ustilago sp. UG-2017b]|nr:uncharacterized protein UHOD_11140 [Ustilago sp. UG-2017b]
MPVYSICGSIILNDKIGSARSPIRSVPPDLSESCWIVTFSNPMLVRSQQLPSGQQHHLEAQANAVVQRRMHASNSSEPRYRLVKPLDRCFRCIEVVATKGLNKAADDLVWI